MAKTKVAVTIYAEPIIKIDRIEHRRLAEECAKLDPDEERQLAEEGMSGEIETWQE
jgi:hypothetical protein